MRNQAEWVPILLGRGIPGGPVPLSDYVSLKEEILRGLEEAGPLDGLILDLHGAMSVVGLDDPEGDLAAAVRGVVGSEVLISTGMDLHGNVSWRLAQSLDLLTCYRTAPHEDETETKQRAVWNLLQRFKGKSPLKPFKAWVPVPILLPGEKTSTRVEPAKSLYEMVTAEAARDGVLDAAVWVGYAWADEPRNHAVVMVTGDDKAVISDSAGRIAQAFWDHRTEFEFGSPVGTLEDCLQVALEGKRTPFFISDSGDNPTAGGAGDVSWTLGELLARPELASGEVRAIYASIPDSVAVSLCVQAGVGSEVDVMVGAVVDDRPSGPVRLRGIVEHVRHGDRWAQQEVVVRSGGLQVILTKNRKPYHLESDFLQNGLNPREADIVVVKIGYLEPELFAMANGQMMALTPGGVDQDLLRLGHQRINRPMYPFDPDMETPDLTPRFVPASAPTPVGQR